MATEGKVDLTQSINDTVQNLGNLAVSSISAIDKGLQNMQPSIETLNKSMTGMLETGAKTATDVMNNLSDPLNNIVSAAGDTAAKGIETVSGVAGQALEIVGSAGNSAISIAQSAVGTVGSAVGAAGEAVSSVLPVGKKI